MSWIGGGESRLNRWFQDPKIRNERPQKKREKAGFFDEKQRFLGQKWSKKRGFCLLIWAITYLTNDAGKAKLKWP
jgi:hypothetical protein